MTTTSGPISVLVVDDSPSICAGLGKLIEGEAPNFKLLGCTCTGPEALTAANQQPDVIIMDLMLGDNSSIELIPELIRRSQGQVLIHTGIGDRRLHGDAMLFGTLGIVPKSAAAAVILEAIECVHGGSFWSVGLTPITVESDNQSNGIDFLSPAELALINELVSHWHTPVAHPLPMQAVTGHLVSIYNKLGLRNRSELVRFAITHHLVEAPWQLAPHVMVTP